MRVVLPLGRGKRKVEVVIAVVVVELMVAALALHQGIKIEQMGAIDASFIKLRQGYPRFLSGGGIAALLESNFS